MEKQIWMDARYLFLRFASDPLSSALQIHEVLMAAYNRDHTRLLNCSSGETPGSHFGFSIYLCVVLSTGGQYKVEGSYTVLLELRRRACALLHYHRCIWICSACAETRHLISWSGSASLLACCRAETVRKGLSDMAATRSFAA